MINKYVLTVLIGALFSMVSEAQIKDRDDDTSAYIGIRSFTNIQSAEKDLPFWFHQQRYGMIDPYSGNSLLYGAMKREYDFDNDFLLTTGAELFIRTSQHSTVSFNQWYLKGAYKDFQILAGRFIDPLAQKEHALSTGSFIMSRNATPIPRIAFQTKGYKSIPGTNEILSAKAYFSHGWFKDDRYTKGAFLHQKYLYLKIAYAFFEAEGGIIHNVQWGGRNSSNGSLPSGFRDFIDVVFASGSSNPEAPSGEQSNVLGNSVGAYDFSLKLKMNKASVRAYRLFYLEDKIAYRFRSPWDGIWGLVLKPEGSGVIQSVLWEHINTKRQDSFDFEPRGTASYYNHGIYRTGWTYNGRVIGNSMLLTDGSLNRPVYNNIVIAHHLGVMGAISGHLDYTFKYTFSRNYGEWDDQVIQFLEPGAPIRAELRDLEELKQLNHSLFFSLGYIIPSDPSLTLGLELAGDFGELYGEQLGIGFNLSYQL